MRVIFKIHIFVFDTVQVHVGGKATSIKTVLFCAVKTRPLFKIHIFVIDTEQINLGRIIHKFIFLCCQSATSFAESHFYVSHNANPYLNNTFKESLFCVVKGRSLFKIHTFVVDIKQIHVVGVIYKIH